MQRPRGAAGTKLAVPRPVNLPSIKKVRRANSRNVSRAILTWPPCAQEHAGNDPTTQLVPTSGGSGTWTKPEDEVATLTASSTWASQPGPWQPPSAAPSAPPAQQHHRGPSDRVLNPEEYPSLSAAAKAEAAASGASFSRLGKPGFDQAVSGDTFWLTNLCRPSRALHRCLQDARWAEDERGGWRGANDW